MIRKTLFPVFCAASFAAAIPLHIGESWVWQVTNRDNLDLTYRSAVVVDSARIPAGKVWTLVARDSVLKMSDTAKILVWPNGRQTWLRQSLYLNWELQPRDPGDSSIFIIGEDTTSIWGEASSLEPGVHRNRFEAKGVKEVCDSGRGGALKLECDFVSMEITNVRFDGNSVSVMSLYYVGYKRTPAPIHVWSDTLGMERALTFYQSSRGRDWRLVAHDHGLLVPPKDRLSVPAVGTVVSWVVGRWKRIDSTIIEGNQSVYEDSISQRTQWKVSSTKPDSIGWLGFGISQTAIDCSWKSSCRSWFVGCTPPIAEPVCQTPSTQEFVLRIHPNRGQSFVSAENLFPLQNNWMRSWEASEAIDSTTLLRDWVFENSNTVRSGQSLNEVRKEGVLKGWSSSYIWKPGGFGGVLTSFEVTSEGSSFELIGVYPPGTEPPLAIRSKASEISSLKDLAHTFPNASIRWSTASGRTGTLAASEFVRTPVALRGKTLFLQARLPDGRLWQGTHVMP